MLLRRSLSTASSSSLLSSTLGCSRKVVLNREKALNSLDQQMCAQLKLLLTQWNQDPNVSAMLMRGAGGKAFCAGGDVKSMYHAIKEKGPLIGVGHPGESSADFFRVEYEMNHMLHKSAVPQVSFWDGFVMGGGVGVSIFGNFRVATENTVFAMPETGIGLFPDVGSTSWLPGIPYGMGEYIALSGGKLKAADLLFAGIATHYMPSERYEELEHIMTNLPKGNRLGARQALEVALDAITAEYVGNPNSELKEQKQVLETNLSVIRRCFDGAETVEGIIEGLSKEDGDDKFVASTLKTLRRVSPTSLKLTLEALHRAKGKDLKECLEMEYRMVQGCMRYNDFAEGVRALLVDRDNTPVWNPSSLEGVTQESINAFFQPLGDNELKLE